MLLILALAICIVVGIFGGNSRARQLGWIGAGIALVALVFVAWTYHSDAHKLPQWVEKRSDLVTRLRTNKICLDMETNPEGWTGRKLEYPCIGYGADQLRDQIAKQEQVLQEWNRTIEERQALLKARETGHFWFIQKVFGDPYD